MNRGGIGYQGTREIERGIAFGFDWHLHLSADGLRNAWLVRQKRPGARNLLRMYDSDRYAKPGDIRAPEDAHWIGSQDIRDDQGQRVDPWSVIDDVICDNEWNLAVEHGNKPGRGHDGQWDSEGEYRELAVWWTGWATTFRRLIPASHRERIQLHNGALAPGRQPWGRPAEYEYTLLGSALPWFDRNDIHVYGDPADEWTGTGRLGRIVAAINAEYDKRGKPRPRLALTETNSAPPSSASFVDILRHAATFPQIECLCWFLWAAADPAHQAFDLIARPDAELAALQYYLARDKVLEGEPMPTDPFAGVGPGVKAKMQEQQDKPLSPEQYVGADWSITFGGKGMYLYSRHANKTYFLPAR